jgi:hypothetical protein
MKIYINMIKEMSGVTNASSVKILAKQYYPDIGGKNNPTGYIYWKLNNNEKIFSFHLNSI